MPVDAIDFYFRRSYGLNTTMYWYQKFQTNWKTCRRSRLHKYTLRKIILINICNENTSFSSPQSKVGRNYTAHLGKGEILEFTNTTNIIVVHRIKEKEKANKRKRATNSEEAKNQG